MTIGSTKIVSENPMNAKMISQMHAYRIFQHLRRSVIMPLLYLLLFAYFGFISFVAYAPTILGQTVGGGTMSMGLYLALGLFILAFLITALFIHFLDHRARRLLVVLHHKAEGPL